MIEAGCEAWYPSEALAVMGLAEILTHLPRLLRLRKDLVTRLLAARPDVFVGIDSPEFNLRVAAQLKARGIPTVQYVSPQVWAWRQGRVRTIGRSVDLVLCVLPFESRFYDEHRCVRCSWDTRWPTACRSSRRRARPALALGLPASAPIVAVLPGSRGGEVAKLGPPFAATIAWLQCAAAGARVRRADGECAGARRRSNAAWPQFAPGVPVSLVDGRAQEATHRRRRGAGGIRHGHARDRARQAPDGGRLPRRAR